MRASIRLRLWAPSLAITLAGAAGIARAPGPAPAATAPAAHSAHATPALASHAHGGASTAPAASAPTDDEARALIGAAREAAIRGQWARADAALRSAWRSPTMRRLAARALWDLHQRPGFALGADEQAISDTTRLLGPRYRRFETPHFVILTDADARWSRARATILEQTRRQFYRAMDRLGYPAVPHEHKLVCILMREHDQFRVFAAREDGHVAEWSAGYYSTGANRVVFYNDDSAPALREAMRKLDEYQAEVRQLRDQAITLTRAGRASEAQRRRRAADDLEGQVSAERARLQTEAGEFSVAKTIHEAVHLLAFNSGVQLPSRQYPFWLSEGLACAFEAPTTRSAFGPDFPSPGREAQARALYTQDAALPLEQLITMTEAPADARPLADAMYAQSFALVELLYHHRPLQLGELILSLADAPDSTLDAEGHLARFRRLIGDPADISGEIARRWALE